MNKRKENNNDKKNEIKKMKKKKINELWLYTISQIYLVKYKIYNSFILNMQVVGVAQIINKMPGPVPFTEEDEEVISVKAWLHEKLFELFHDHLGWPGNRSYWSTWTVKCGWM